MGKEWSLTSKNNILCKDIQRHPFLVSLLTQSSGGVGVDLSLHDVSSAAANDAEVHPPSDPSQ